MNLGRRLAVVAAAVVIDRCTPEPPNRWHPVAWFGTTMTAVEERLWADERRRGAAYTALGVGLGMGAGRLVRSSLPALVIALGTDSLRATAADIGSMLERGDLEAARAALPALVGRDPSELDEAGIAAAVVESVAENTVDATIAPIFWTLVAGAPGALGYRAVNTMDAMVGHRSERHLHFGWASARLDDVVNWVPARLFAALVAAAAPQRRAEIGRAIREDAPAHPSPNAGVAESAVAAALGVELGGRLRYGERIEDRPLLGSGPRPEPTTIGAANRLIDRTLVVFGAAAGAVHLSHRIARRVGA